MQLTLVTVGVLSTSLAGDTLAHQAPLCQIDISLGCLLDCTWKRLSDHQRSKWLDQICSDNDLLPDDLWRHIVV